MIRFGVLTLWLSLPTILCIQVTSAHPSVPIREDGRSSLGIKGRAGVNLMLPSNSTVTYPGELSSDGMLCFEAAEGRGTTSIDGCRPTLNYIRGLPQYRLVQEFQEGRNPKFPSKPPYIFTAKGSTCAIQLASGSNRIIDTFSFEQVRTLATDIVEDCQEQGGYGGVAKIGSRGLGWKVKLIGLTVVETT